MRLVWILFWFGLGLLLVAAGVRLRARLRRRSDPWGPTVDDEALRRIVEEGRLVTDEDEPLDLREIREEERRFWEEERWDEADEF